MIRTQYTTTCHSCGFTATTDNEQELTKLQALHRSRNAWISDSVSHALKTIAWVQNE